MSANELAAALGVKTRKIVCTFDSPVYAKAELVALPTTEGAAPVPRSASIATTTPQKEIPLCYTERDITEGRSKSRILTFQVGGGLNSYAYPLRELDVVSATAHESRPPIALPSIVDPKKPVYVLLFWDPENPIDPTIPPEEIVRKMKRGYYLVLYFSRTPF